MSFLEIYREKVHDLLATEPWASDLPVRETADHTIVIPGLSRQPLKSLSDFEKWFHCGVAQRSTASTALNVQSSRSHSCVILYLYNPNTKRHSKLHLIDLAGSEDNRRTANQGDRLIESGAINRSLFVLSQVVEALNQPSSLRIPYRDSKLTRLLQDSLGGNCQSLMIANVVGTEAMLWETYCTLNFAAKSRQIENRVEMPEEKSRQDILEKENSPKLKRKADTWDRKKEKEGQEKKSRKEDTNLLLSPPETGKKEIPRTPEQGIRAVEGRTAQIERQIDAKVEERLKALYKGVSPLLKVSQATMLVSDINGQLASVKPKGQDPILMEGCKRIVTLEKELESSLLTVLNHAPVKLLCQLPECGPKRAKVIMESRETVGPFQGLMDLIHRDLLTMKVLWRMVSEMAINRAQLGLLRDKVNNGCAINH